MLTLAMPTNVLGTEMKCCCRDPMTGFFRDGFCRTGPEDLGLHTVCVKVTREFLDFSVLDGNDLVTPHLEWGFPGLQPGDENISRLPDGVTVWDVTTHVDERGTVCEMFDSRWNWHPAPLVFAYTFSLRPGMIKGWGMHQFHEDRYFILFGELLLVLYDDRPSSPTNGLVAKVAMSEYR